jgi:hypothetical protein
MAVMKDHDFGERLFTQIAIEQVTAYIKKRLDKSAPEPVFEVYVVWFAKTLQHWKALVASDLPDGMYYELTFNGVKNELYLDAYRKVDNVTVKL